MDFRGLEISFTNQRCGGKTCVAVEKRKVAISQLLSTKNAGKCGNNKVDAVSDRLGEITVGAKLLAEADEDEGLDQPVKMSSHAWPSLAERILVVV